MVKHSITPLKYKYIRKFKKQIEENANIFNIYLLQRFV